MPLMVVYDVYKSKNPVISQVRHAQWLIDFSGLSEERADNPSNNS